MNSDKNCWSSPEFRRRRTPARRSRSNGIGEWFALRTTEQLFCFLALLFKGKIQQVAADPAAMHGVPAQRAPPLHYLHEHAWRRGPATPKDSPSHITCTGDPPKQGGGRIC
jgi:hypothetical protein